MSRGKKVYDSTFSVRLTKEQREVLRKSEGLSRKITKIIRVILDEELEK